MEPGADDYIIKPFDGTELLNAVEARLKKNEKLKQQLNIGTNNLTDFLNSAKQSGNIQLIFDEKEVYDYKKKHVVYAEAQKPRAVYYVVSGKKKFIKQTKKERNL